MTGNIVLPTKLVIGSDNGMQVVDLEDSDYDDIMTNHCIKYSRKRHQKKKSSQCPTPCFRGASNKKTRSRRPDIMKVFDRTNFDFLEAARNLNKENLDENQSRQGHQCYEVQKYEAEVKV